MKEFNKWEKKQKRQRVGVAFTVSGAISLIGFADLTIIFVWYGSIPSGVSALKTIKQLSTQSVVTVASGNVGELTYFMC